MDKGSGQAKIGALIGVALLLVVALAFLLRSPSDESVPIGPPQVNESPSNESIPIEPRQANETLSNESAVTIRMNESGSRELGHLNFTKIHEVFPANDSQVYDLFPATLIIDGESDVKFELELLQNVETQEWSRVIVRLKNPGTTTDVISTLSEDEFRRVQPDDYGFSGEVSKQGFEKLLQDNRVKEIYYNSISHLALDDSVSFIEVDPEVWNVGFNGSGIKICVIDSGVNKSHPALGGTIIDEYCFCSLPDTFGEYCCPNNQSNDSDATDNNGHGTQVTGIIASQDSSYKGVAYGSEIYVVKVSNSSGDQLNNDIGKAVSWCDNHWHVDVISISLGDGENHPGDTPCPSDYNQEINNASTYHGIPVIVASGNEGYTTGMSYAACNPTTISVGSVYHFNDTRNYTYGNVTCTDNASDVREDKIACFTNRDSTLDLLAPGSNITSTNLTGGFGTGGSLDSGTSFSAPHVAGAAALLIQYYRERFNETLTPSQLRDLLKTSGKTVYDPATGNNYSRIDVLEAMKRLQVSGLQELHSEGTARLFEFHVNNSGIVALENVSWVFDAGDGTVINSTSLLDLAAGESVPVYVHYNFTNSTYSINVTVSAQYLADSQVLELDLGAINLTGLQKLDSAGTDAILAFSILNNGDTFMDDVSWTLNMGDGTVLNSTMNMTLEANESASVFVGYTYGSLGNYTVTATALSSGTVSNQSISVVLTGIDVKSLSVLSSNSTRRIFGFIIANGLGSQMAGINFTFSTGDGTLGNSTQPITLAADEEVFVYYDYNYSGAGTYAVNASATDGTHSDWENMTVTVS